ncbi:MAG TPA: cystatin domain-containing protein [Pyrinomonadaceae bacterium]|jgi:predicted methyltransferase
MRNILRAALLLFVFGVTFGASHAGAAGQGPAVGGFKPVATNDPRVVEAARAAVASEAKKEKTNIRLLSVVAAEQKVVQGMVYRLCLRVEVEDAENNVDVATNVSAQVFMSLKKQYQLNSWEEADCGGEDEEEQ